VVDRRSKRAAAGMMIALAGLVAGCDAPQPQPRSFFVFMDDGIAREGVLARCNRDRHATANDVECNNARRAAAAVALERERSRSASLEEQSERKLLALRVRAARDAEAQQQAEAEARVAEEQAYEQQWRNTKPEDAIESPAPPAFEVAVIAPPVNDVLIAPPTLELEELATVPRPFRTDSVSVPQ
jgi:beta-glucosidase-like glycosyl hydrolase